MSVTAAITGTMMDLADGTSIEFLLPARYTGTIDMEAEQVPNIKRNAALNFYDYTMERLSMELVFLHRGPDALADVITPFNWLVSRYFPRYLADKVLLPPPTFAVQMSALLPLFAEWEFDPGSFEYDGEGNCRLPALGLPLTQIPAKLVCRFGLVRVDSGGSRDTR